MPRFVRAKDPAKGFTLFFRYGAAKLALPDPASVPLTITSYAIGKAERRRIHRESASIVGTEDGVQRRPGNIRVPILVRRTGAAWPTLGLP